MEKFIPYEKLSKRKRREIDAARRGSWGALSPVTRRSVNPKAYDRAKARKRSFDASEPCLCCAYLTDIISFISLSVATASMRMSCSSVYTRLSSCSAKAASTNAAFLHSGRNLS